jgi:hypothetical protein
VRAFLWSAHGSVTAEYVMVLVLVALPCALAVRAVGPKLVALFLAEKAVLLFPLSF